MNAEILYRVEYIPHPYDEKLRKECVKAYCLVEFVKPESGLPSMGEPVAIFNYDSDARSFMDHVLVEGLDKKLVDIDEDHRERLVDIDEDHRERLETQKRWREEDRRRQALIR